MIGSKVLCPMRVAPLAYSYGVIRRHNAHNPALVEVDMPYKKAQVSQAFYPHQLIFCKD